ncbi:MAG: SpoIIE family protein phosphatase, partial [Bacteroidia bacterium]|nr:SpoIIE family protein phosphatase [Bacteroidia bacterium]
QKNDVIFLYTDGMADQFGGPLGKKFRYKQLDALLVENSDKQMSELKQILFQNFVNWKGNLGQTDDVCVIGIRV